MSESTKEQVTVPSVKQVEGEMEKIRHKKLFRKTLLSTFATLVVVAAIAVLISTLLLPVIQVSGSSMEPNLRDGDILVLTKSQSADYSDLCCVSWQNKLLLKRIIGMPGDSITIDADGNVYRNNVRIDEPYVIEKSLGNCELTFPFVVPENKYFILGDNRATSVDSRNAAIGCVGQDQIVGRVLFKIWPLGDRKS